MIFFLVEGGRISWIHRTSFNSEEKPFTSIIINSGQKRLLVAIFSVAALGWIAG